MAKERSARSRDDAAEINRVYEQMGILDPTVRAQFVAYVEPEPMQTYNIQVVVSSASDPFNR